MIGVVGSHDSVAHVLKVSEEMDLAEGLITRSYDSPAEAPVLAAEIDSSCRVILFTGRVPYEFTLAQGALTATAQYIPHSALDLYRTLVLLAQQFEGRIPSISIDTIDRDIVQEIFKEIGVAPPQGLFPLADSVPQLSVLTERMVAFHRAEFERGDIEVCVTCMSTVREQLASEGIPVTRVMTTDSSVRDSLNRAALTSQLQRSESSQVAVLALTGGSTLDEGVEASLTALADHLDGRLISDGGSTVIVTTRGPLERELQSRKLQKVLQSLETAAVWIGVGLGNSLPDAEQNANYAVTVAAATQAHHEVLPDGSIRRLTDSDRSLSQMRNTDARKHALARLGGIGPMTIFRLQAALASLGRDDLTARELAQAYGVEPRSARRLLASLHKAGIASPLGAYAAPRAGRPQVIYKIDLQLLFDVGSASTAEDAIDITRGN
jgi:hypothetical protein